MTEPVNGNPGDEPRSIMDRWEDDEQYEATIVRHSDAALDLDEAARHQETDDLR